MSKLRLYLAITLLAMLSLASGCLSGSALEAGLGEEFSLHLGQRALIRGENLTIEFQEVVEDSRCPRGVSCVWAGRVTCIIEIARAGSSYRMGLTQPGLTEEYSREKYQAYELAFKVTPYPEVNREIKPEAYELHLIVTKAPALTEVLGSILLDPASFEGKEITVVGYYRGWDLLQEANLPPPVTRSDWVLKDASGAIYVSASSIAGIPEGLHPTSMEDTRAIVEVQGIVHLNQKGQPYIEATSIRRVS